MTIQEIISLTRAGYKKKDIDAMIADEQADAGKTDPEPDKKTDPEPDAKDQPDTGNGPKEGAEGEPAPDDHADDDSINAEIEKLRAELADTQKKLAAAQKENIKKNSGSHTDPAADRDKRIADYARSLM